MTPHERWVARVLRILVEGGRDRSKSMSSEVEAIVSQIERDQEFLIDLTRRLVRIPTVNPKFEADPELNREPDLQEVVRAELERIGMETEVMEVLPDRPNVTGTLAGDDERSLILNGHVDVVPVGERSLWSVH